MEPIIKAGSVNRLVEFRPHLADTGILTFYCPSCLGSSAEHKIRIPLAPTVVKGRSWQHDGSLAELTLLPSVNVGCWHGTITKGMVHTC